jgi:hypothetical protein
MFALSIFSSLFTYLFLSFLDSVFYLFSFYTFPFLVVFFSLLLLFYQTYFLFFCLFFFFFYSLASVRLPITSRLCFPLPFFILIFNFYDLALRRIVTSTENFSLYLDFTNSLTLCTRKSCSWTCLCHLLITRQFARHNFTVFLVQIKYFRNHVCATLCNVSYYRPISISVQSLLAVASSP